MIRVRSMTGADVRFGLRLTRQAGWIQTDADWRRHLALQPDGCFVAELGGEPAGTLTTAIHGTVAWIAMMLVEQGLRGRGIGRALMTRVLQVLDDRGVPTARLDATPLGQPLYESLGFVAEYTLERYQGQPSAAAGQPAAQPLDSAHLDALLAFDRAVAGYDRSRLVRRLAEEFPESVRVVARGESIEGYVMARPEVPATLVAPCLATPEAGPLLFADVCTRMAGRPVILDVPTDHREAHAIVRSQGFAVQRRLLRMYRGETVAEQTAAIWASAGPDLG